MVVVVVVQVVCDTPPRADVVCDCMLCSPLQGADDGDGVVGGVRYVFRVLIQDAPPQRAMTDCGDGDSIQDGRGWGNWRIIGCSAECSKVRRCSDVGVDLLRGPRRFVGRKKWQVEWNALASAINNTMAHEAR